MTDSDQPPPPDRLRWSRSQRFRLTARGVDAELQWRSCLTEVQAAGGRAAFDAGLASWASRFQVHPDDAAYVRELSQTPLRLEDVAKSVADTGATRADAKKSLTRLLDAGLVEPVPKA